MLHNRRRLGLLVAICALSLCGCSHPAVAPTSYTHYVGSDKSFSCDAPAGWDVIAADTSTTSVGGAVFKTGDAKIDITTGSTADVLASDLLHSSSLVPTSLTGSKAEALQSQSKKKVSGIVKGYNEQNGLAFSCGYADAICAEWTATGNFFGMGGPLHGYRASLVNGSHTATVVCQCADSEWPTLKPAFQHVLQSMAAPQEANAPPLAGLGQ
jgi:hypothetical protein